MIAPSNLRLLSLKSHLSTTQMSGRQKWTRGRPYWLHTGYDPFKDKFWINVMGTDISSLGTHFIRRSALERDLDFETGHSWTFFTVDVCVSILCIPIKLKKILWFPGCSFFSFLIFLFSLPLPPPLPLDATNWTDVQSRFLLGMSSKDQEHSVSSSILTSGTEIYTIWKSFCIIIRSD
jgi:hypothetical protein